MPENFILSWISRTMSRWETALIAFSGLALFLIMLIVVLDVVMRYLFAAPLGWSYDLISLYLMVAVFFLALPDTLHHHGHIAIDLFQAWFPRRFLHGAEAVGYLLTTVIVAIMTWLAWERMSIAYMAGDRMAASIPWPTWIAYLIVMLGTGALTLRCAYRVIGHTLSCLTGRRGVETPPPPMTAIETGNQP